ncbi:hypothetical protein CsSME_00018576 [Camellia sinensis var. sinensis]
MCGLPAFSRLLSTMSLLLSLYLVWILVQIPWRMGQTAKRRSSKDHLHLFPVTCIDREVSLEQKILNSR